jgi:hypothetical protein
MTVKIKIALFKETNGKNDSAGISAVPDRLDP